MKTIHTTLKYGLVLLVLVISLAYFFIADAEYSEPRLIVIGDSLSTTHESWRFQVPTAMGSPRSCNSANTERAAR